MRRDCLVAFAAVLFSALSAIGQNSHNAAPDSHQQSVGLVLSGGGAKGIAHIGVIQALEENNISIDYVTGTSMGAIIGGLYACGYTPDEMLALILSKPFSYWSTGQIDPDDSFYFASEPPSPVMLSIPFSTKKDSIENAKSAVPASVISPMPMNFAFMELFSPYTAQCGGDFNKLFVPFRCVASDVAAKHKVVLDHGDVGYSIRSSMSFPIVFQPTQIDSMLLYDGGIYDNFPADVMNEDFAPDFLLGMDVSTEAIGPQTSLMDQLDKLVVQSSNYDLDPANGIKIRFDLNQFGLLDFPQAKQIYKIGYDKTMEMMDSIKSRIHSRVSAEDRELRRRVFKSQTPYLRFDSVSVHGASPSQNEYISYLFNSAHRDTISVKEARSAYYRAITPGKLRDLVPHAYYNDSTGLYHLDLKASVKDDFKFGVGGYITSSTSSFVYLSAGYSTLSFRSVSANVGAWIGQSYLGAMFTSRLYMPTSIPSALELQAVVFRQKYYDKDYLFFEEKNPGDMRKHQYFGRLKWAWACGSLWNMEVGAGYGHTVGSYYSPANIANGNILRDSNKFNLGQALIQLESNTLDDINFPTMGRYYHTSVMGMMGDYRHTYGDEQDTHHSRDMKWLQFENVTRNYFQVSNHFALGVESDVLLSTKKLLYDYQSTMVSAPAFTPTPSSYNRYNPAFRSNSFAAVGLVPIYKFSTSLAARVQGYCFMPIRKIESTPSGGAGYARGWLSSPEYMAEFDVTYKLPFATVVAYCNYYSKPTRDWSVGIAFGVFLPAPNFMR